MFQYSSQFISGHSFFPNTVPQLYSNLALMKVQICENGRLRQKYEYLTVFTEWAQSVQAKG